MYNTEFISTFLVILLMRSILFPFFSAVPRKKKVIKNLIIRNTSKELCISFWPINSIVGFNKKKKNLIDFLILRCFGTTFLFQKKDIVVVKL